ncbi:FecR domain-containing protein [Tsuneonella sp. YG55]|uniref:FecR domain-containing protein n=1 Tax=Tsuneonella litorea TaxID=2976475 RepID=A0A9X3AAS7_9SPHN|nr:FecR domain-containing protein [Tsuneonella litorea]MCT2560190.1 FecR domain-containing protein [Tsuneonella litorea]
MADMHNDRTRAEAIDWHLRLEHGGEDDWHSFTEWLEADPAHSRAYDSVANAEGELDAVLRHAEFPAPMPASDTVEPVESMGRNLWLRRAAIAASIVIVGALTFQIAQPASTYSIATGPGETREIALADGGTISLNGNSEVILDRDDTRSVELAVGEARFEVTHDARVPFTVTVGANRLVDIGTVFNVSRDANLLRVGVAEGAVRFEGSGHSLRLGPGDVLRARGDSIKTTSAPAEAIGSWTGGTLVYDDAPIADVAADVGRAVGVRIAVDPAIGSRNFSGVLQTRGGAQMVRGRMGPVLGVRIEDTTGGWTLKP